MKILGITLGKEKAVSFHEFRDMVRLAVRRENPGARLEPNENGFTLYREGEAPITCNIKQLYGNYYKDPGNRDALITQWIASLTFETPQHTWTEAALTLRPTLKNTAFIEAANKSLAKNQPPDSLPSEPFAGELHTIVVRDLPGTAVAVTQSMLDEWGVNVEQCLAEAMGNMGIMSFPNVINALMSGSTGKRSAMQEEVGLVFKGDHLTATWLVSDRFRDYIAQRLQGDYVASLPSRGELTVVRADEPGLISSVIQGARSFTSKPYPLTAQLFYVSAATTGGAITVYQPGQTYVAGRLDPAAAPPVTQGLGGNSAAIPAAAPVAMPPAGLPATMAPAAPAAASPYSAPATAQPVKALNDYFSLSESTADEPQALPPPTINAARKR